MWIWNKLWFWGGVASSASMKFVRRNYARRLSMWRGGRPATPSFAVKVQAITQTLTLRRHCCPFDVYINPSAFGTTAWLSISPQSTTTNETAIKVPAPTRTGSRAWPSSRVRSFVDETRGIGFRFSLHNFAGHDQRRGVPLPSACVRGQAVPWCTPGCRLLNRRELRARRWMAR